MKIGKVVELEHYTSCSPEQDGITFNEVSGARIHIPAKLLISLYEALKWDFEKKQKSGLLSHLTWDTYCESFFEKD